MPRGKDFLFDLDSAPPPPPPGMGAPPPGPGNVEELDFSDLGSSSSSAPTESYRAPAEPEGDAFGGNDFLDFSDLNSSPGTGAPVELDPFAQPAPAPAPSGPGRADFGPRGQMLSHSVAGVAGPFAGNARQPLSITPAAPTAAADVRCKSCGKVLTDPFDQALGVCDDCRNNSSQPVSLADMPPVTTPVGSIKPVKVAAPPPNPSPALVSRIKTVDLAES